MIVKLRDNALDLFTILPGGINLRGKWFYWFKIIPDNFLLMSWSKNAFRFTLNTEIQKVKLVRTVFLASGLFSILFLKCNILFNRRLGFAIIAALSSGSKLFVVYSVLAKNPLLQGSNHLHLAWISILEY